MEKTTDIQKIENNTEILINMSRFSINDGRSFTLFEGGT